MAICDKLEPLFWVSAATVPSDGTFEPLAEALLAPDETAQLAAIRHAGRRRQWLTGRLLAKRVLDGHAPPDDDLPLLAPSDLLATRSAWQIGRAADGAPRPRRGNGRPLHLSLSHSGGVALAAASDRRVGVDVEEVASPIRDLMGAPAEAAWIAGAPPAEAALATLLWCGKEALLKTGAFGAVSASRAMALALDPELPAGVVVKEWSAGRGWRPLPVRVPAYATAVRLIWRPIGSRHVAVVACLPNPPEADTVARNTTGGVRRMIADAPMAAVRRSTPVLERVKRVFVDVVRYPANAFDGIDDDLENDLGIDSVKLGEVLVALRAEFRLGQDDILPDRIAPEGTRTLSGIARTIEDALRDHTASMAPPPLGAAKLPAPLTSAAHANSSASETAPAQAARRPAPSSQAAAAHASTSDVLVLVTRAFADVTRYPLDILQPEADLEDDLGIDSVKLGEIMATLRNRFRVPPADEWPNALPRTIADVARIVSARARDADTPEPMPANRPSAPAAPRPTGRRFDGKIALVTGSGHGAGRVHALRLAELGADVIVNSFHSRERGDGVAAEIAANGGKAHHIWGSVCNPTHVERIYAEIAARWGGLDFLVNNASHTVLKPFGDITADDLLKTYSTNVVAVQLGSLAAAKLMAKRGGGRIVTLSALASRHVAPLYGAMAPVNAAVETLTRYLAVELMAANVQVNCLAVGFGARDLAVRWPDKTAHLPKWEAAFPDEAPCTAEEVAEMVAFLLGAETRQLNGSIITMDGGSATALAGAAR